ncbi:Hypothetical Protein FCC1311_064442 [Hondaea fermentalgiana]|uniref:Uncharacterized protein n=1 Tax=Hondaea fermentalgiana TaxID=2315210 RepID=A0A2R5GQR8_9STRA|nr:Hypothetical Protein FCC1311_064442 [Hondaea fermentalgiana]|eukprot:GBG30224.1 Hypothetical Protein FCC1311_064442 [Hondaea fermentalgiana]
MTSKLKMPSRLNMIALCKSVKAMCGNLTLKVPAIVQAGFEVMKDTESKAMAEIQKIIEDAPNVVAGKAEEFRAVLTQNFDAVADKVAVFVEACNSADHATMGIAGAALVTAVILLGMSCRRGRKRASPSIAGFIEDIKDVTMETEVQKIDISAENSAAGQAKEGDKANGDNAADNTEDKIVDDDKAEAQDKAQAKYDKAEVKPEDKVADQTKDEAKDAEAMAVSAADQSKDDMAEDDKAVAKDAETMMDSAADQAKDDKAEDDKAEAKFENQAKAQVKDDKAEDSAADQAKDEYEEEDKIVEEDKEMSEPSIVDYHMGEPDDSQSTVADAPNGMTSISPADKKKKKFDTTWKSHGTDREVPVKQAMQPSRSTETNTSRRDTPAYQPSKSTERGRTGPKSTKHGRTGPKPKRFKYESLPERKSQPFITRSSQGTSDPHGSDKEIPHGYFKRSRETESKIPEATQTQRRCASKNETEVIEIDD